MYNNVLTVYANPQVLYNCVIILAFENCNRNTATLCALLCISLICLLEFLTISKLSHIKLIHKHTCTPINVHHSSYISSLSYEPQLMWCNIRPLSSIIGSFPCMINPSPFGLGVHHCPQTWIVYSPISSSLYHKHTFMICILLEE